MDALDFSVDLSGIDTSAVLADALWRVDALEGHLGDDSGDAPPGPAGALLRSMNEDIAEFAAYPVIYSVDKADFEERDGKVPEQLLKLAERNRFYRVEFPVVLFPRSSWKFDRLEVILEFNPDGEGATRPKVFDIFPNRELRTLGHVKHGVSVKLDAGLKFAAMLPTPVDNVGASIESGANNATELAIGPFDYELKRLVVETTPPGLEKVRWRLEGDEHLQESPPRFIVLLQVPAVATDVKVLGALQAYRNYNFLTDRVRNTFKELPRAIRTFFQNGAPISAQANYDLTGECIG